MAAAFGMNCDNTFGLMTEMRGADAAVGVCWNGKEKGHGRRERMLPVWYAKGPWPIGLVSAFDSIAPGRRWVPDIKRKRSDGSGVHHGTCLGWKTAASFGTESGLKIKRNDGEKVRQERFPD